MLGRIDQADIPPRSGRMTERSELDICEAVRECAELCLESGDPQLRASDYVTKLKTAGWSDNDVQEVLASALSVFARLVKHFRNGGA
jgi:hypothetical protein